MSVSAVSFEGYIEALRRSGLLKSVQLDPVLQEFPQPPPDCRPLAKRLQTEKLVTSWQNGHLMEGRHKGFFLGNYKLLGLLGHGGMGAVYVAEHTFMRRRVAVKVLYEAQLDQTSLDRFYRECRAVASLDHPNIIRAHDFDSNGEFLYLVMEHIEGPDLHELVEKRGPLPYDEVAEYIRQAAEGLAHAHQEDMVHRDIKPANLLRDPKGSIKILDMGLARILNRDDKPLTMAGNAGILGTVDFLAPEQAMDSHNVDHRADIYSLGCTMFFLICGRAPFAEGALAQRLMKHQRERPPDIRKIRADCPQELIDVCYKLMAKQPDDRYQTADEVAQMLGAWQAANPSPPASAAPAPTAPTPASASSSSDVGERKILLRCDSCRTVFRANPRKADKTKTCPNCGGELVRSGEA